MYVLLVTRMTKYNAMPQDGRIKLNPKFKLVDLKLKNFCLMCNNVASTVYDKKHNAFTLKLEYTISTL